MTTIHWTFTRGCDCCAEATLAGGVVIKATQVDSTEWVASIAIPPVGGLWSLAEAQVVAENMGRLWAEAQR